MVSRWQFDFSKYFILIVKAGCREMYNCRLYYNVFFYLECLIVEKIENKIKLNKLLKGTKVSFIDVHDVYCILIDK